MQPDESTEEERQEELPQDNQTPFQPADPQTEDPLNDTDSTNQPAGVPQDDTHPQTDSNVDSQQLYDEGINNAAEISEPNADSSVTDFNVEDKPKDN